MFMFHNAGGERLTLLVGRSAINRETGFRFFKEGSVRTYYGIDEPMGCALSRAIRRTKLEAAVECVYEALDR